MSDQLEGLLNEGTKVGMNELALFAGAGGGILAGQMLGWRTVVAVERDAYAAQVLAQRQNDGSLKPFPIWADVCSFDGRPWRGLVDVVSGGFPCQDISVAGKGAGIDGERSGMWTHMARIIGEVRPIFAYVENSPALLTRGLGRVLGDLAALGYDCRWTVLGAADVGAPHQRDRFWLVAADADRARELQPEGRQPDKRRRTGDSHSQDAHALRPRLPAPWPESLGAYRRITGRSAPAGSWWPAEPDLVRVVHGLPARMERIACLGNAQVPVCAATAFRMLTAGMREPSNVRAKQP